MSNQDKCWRWEVRVLVSPCTWWPGHITKVSALSGLMTRLRADLITDLKPLCSPVDNMRSMHVGLFIVLSWISQFYVISDTEPVWCWWGESVVLVRGERRDSCCSVLCCRWWREELSHYDMFNIVIVLTLTVTVSLESLIYLRSPPLFSAQQRDRVEAGLGEEAVLQCQVRCWHLYESFQSAVLSCLV